MDLRATVGCPQEWSFRAAKACDDPFNKIDLDVVVTGPSGQAMTMPAFWSGGDVWRVRFAAQEPGAHTWRTVCSDASDEGLHGVEGSLTARPYEGCNPLLAKGAVRVAASQRYLEHADGTPFFWLADTWWMGLCKRITWPGEFQMLVADRVAKGFSTIQIVAGLYPDMGAYDERGLNEAGFPWEPDWARINPAYFDMADLRIDYLVRSGLMPAIVGCWGYYLPLLGLERMKKHWRYLVARWASHPVVWCIAGEVLMPYYLDFPQPPEWQEKYAAEMKAGWSEMAAYVKALDPYKHVMTGHPGNSVRKSLEDEVLDIDWLQTGHGDRASLPPTVQLVVESYAMEPAKPTINSEVNYEGIGEASRQEVQRMAFWLSVLNGTCGHTYGANGIWQFNGATQPYGASPHGMAWGDTPWEEAFQLPGSKQMGIAKALLERYRWWEFVPHKEWMEPHWSPENYLAPHAAGIEKQVKIIYMPGFMWGGFKVCGLEPGVKYHAYYFDPKNGREYEIGEAVGDEEGKFAPPASKIFQDWIIVLEADGARVC